MLGLTFKENVPDLRNSRTFDLVAQLRALGHQVEVADPLASADEVEREYALKLVRLGGRTFDLVIGAVAHQDYRAMTDEALGGLIAEGGMLADLKGMWRDRALDPAIKRWQL